jgi:nicotinate-nucleotide adenylyltransferase
MSIALFGTSADPPTTGHRALLRGLLAHFPKVATWASDNPLKPRQAPLETRVALLAALVEAIADPRLTLAQDLSSPWATETLARARTRWPRDTPVFVVGSDLIGQMPRWRQATELLSDLELAVVPREGWPVQDEELALLRRLGSRVRLLPLPIPATASTSARGEGGAAGDPAQVPEELWPLLRQHGLYGLSSTPAPP